MVSLGIMFAPKVGFMHGPDHGQFMVCESTRHVKVVVFLPLESLEGVMEAVDRVMTPIYDHYDHVYSYSECTGTWRPLPGAYPYIGEVGKVELGEELRLEFTIRADEVSTVLKAVRGAHPYETPAIDVYPMMTWRDLIGE